MHSLEVLTRRMGNRNFKLDSGAFGIANIMFVTVKERTAMIGLKKAIGAKSEASFPNFY